MLEETCSLGKAQGKIRDDRDHSRILNFIVSSLYDEMLFRLICHSEQP